jgi:hypothetical protein
MTRVVPARWLGRFIGHENRAAFVLAVAVKLPVRHPQFPGLADLSGEAEFAAVHGDHLERLRRAP